MSLTSDDRRPPSSHAFPLRLAILCASLAAAFALALVAVWSGSFDLAFVSVPVVLLAWGLASLGAVVQAWREYFRGRGSHAAALSALPISALAAALNAGGLWMFAINAGDLIHFEVMRPSYVRSIDAMPISPFRLKIFDWGGFGVSHTVVYDASDEIVLPRNARSREWTARAAGTELECGVWGRSLGQHFFLVRIGC